MLRLLRSSARPALSQHVRTATASTTRVWRPSQSLAASRYTDVTQMHTLPLASGVFARTKVDLRARNTGDKLDDILTVLSAWSNPNFVETVECAVMLNIDAKKTQDTAKLRGMIRLPHSLGKKVRVAVFAQGPNVTKAEEILKSLGAEVTSPDGSGDVVGAEELADSITRGQLDYDHVIATPDMMGTVGKVARILGPKGLMPNQKLGTITNNLEETLSNLKAGSTGFRVDRSGVIHAGVAAVSFTPAQTRENLEAFLSALNERKPAGMKKALIRQVKLSSTQSRVSYEVNLQDLAPTMKTK
eukprot:GFYU01011354.1.p1 GENE.GFYU01011354.1~~GFYU01011354.1.p1  ORF type:complete len:301 (-),score=49.48 GFYU01011354.1:27-929(-)